MRHYIRSNAIRQSFKLRADEYLREYLECLIASEQPYLASDLDVKFPDWNTENLLQACRFFTSVLKGEMPTAILGFYPGFEERFGRAWGLAHDAMKSSFLCYLDVDPIVDYEEAPWDMIPIKRHYIWDLYERWDYKDRGDILLKDYLENLILSEQPYVVRNLVLKNPDKETENLLQLCKFFTSVLKGKMPTEDVRFDKEFYEKYWRLSDLVDEVNAGA